jgi:hypothetical protein
MGTVHKFKRPPKNRQQFRGYKPRPPRPARRTRWWERSWILWALLLSAAAGFVGVKTLIGNAHASPETFLCPGSNVGDAQFLRCGDRRERLDEIERPGTTR